MTKLWISGSSGFVGKHLYKYLNKLDKYKIEFRNMSDSESENEEQWNDDGEWVSARFTTAADEVYEEWYYIVDGKLSWYGSAKRGLYSE